MVFPKSFCANPDTLSSNSFQTGHSQPEKNRILTKAQQEFTEFSKKLSETGFKIFTFEEKTDSFTPDALFPNNWFCHLPDGRVFLFPMFPFNRRNEFRNDIVDFLKAKETLDLRALTECNLFLEGTGSLVLDHSSKTGFACLSSRTSPQAIDKFSEASGYRITAFDAKDKTGEFIYHTNVMMTLSAKHAVICLDAISESDRQRVIEALVTSGRKILSISFEEMASFAGNMLFIKGSRSYFWACSTRAYEGLTPSSRNELESEAQFVHSDLTTIETYGGGGARCLLAEYFI